MKEIKTYCTRPHIHDKECLKSSTPLEQSESWKCPHNGGIQGSCSKCMNPTKDISDKEEDWDECYCQCHHNTNSGVLCGHCQGSDAVSEATAESSALSQESWEEELAGEIIELILNREANYSDTLEALLKLELDKARKEEREKYIEALIWCSGSDDFQVEGQARIGWEKICQPLIDPISEPKANLSAYKADLIAKAEQLWKPAHTYSSENSEIYEAYDRGFKKAIQEVIKLIQEESK